MKKIAIIGPECTGKTTLAQELSNRLNTVWVPEFARDYVASLNRHYTYNDVEIIAKRQYRELLANYKKAKDFIFFDTDLIITKVWFDVVYNKCPEWLPAAIMSSKIDRYFICNTDIEWVADPVRENGGEMREILLKTYIAEVEKTGIPYYIIRGEGEERVQKALEILEKLTN